jgi:hypothetical protein
MLSNKVDGVSINCGCGIALLVFNLVLGGWSVNYLLDVIFEKTIPFFWAMVIGLFSGQFTVPIAIIVKILEAFNVI